MRYLPFFLSLALLIILFSCSDEVEEKPDEVKTTRRVERIVVKGSYGSREFVFTYPHKGSANVDGLINDQQVQIRLEYNENDDITEAISGSNRIRYQYDPMKNRIGMIDSKGYSTINEFNEKGQLLRELELYNQDTIRVSEYTYNGGSSPIGVTTKNGNITKTYALAYFDEPNPFKGQCEEVYPYDQEYWLGKHAHYGDQLLKSATHQSSTYPQLRWRVSVIDYYESNLIYSLNKSKNEFTVELTSTPNIEWSALIRYAEF